LEPTNGLSGARIALLVDFDNVVLGLEDPGFDIELVVNALRERGTIVLGRVYGDWYRHNRHRRKLMEQGLELVETPAFGPVIKNSADIRIALDGFEIGLTQSHIDTFAIVSGDSDFLPLIKKLQALGRRVLVICGNRFTSDMLRRNCNEFISYENLLAQSVGATEDATTLEGAFFLLHRAMAALRERGSEIRGSGVKQMMLQLNPVFSERTFGCTQFRQFLQKAVNAGVVKLGARDKYSGEFSVLLPDEDEAPVQQKVERRQENRSRREDKIAQIAARIEAVPVVEEEPSPAAQRAPGFPSGRRGIEEEVELETSDNGVFPNGESDYSTEFDEGGAVFADDAFGYEPEAMADAKTDSVQEIAQNVIARSELLARGLRPSKRRFSGRNGRPLLEVEDAEPVEFDVQSENAPEVEAQPEVASEAEAAPEVEAATTPTESRRLRSRRRRRNASGQITVVSDAEETAVTEAVSSDEPSENAHARNNSDGSDTPDAQAIQDAIDDPEANLQISHEPLGDEEAAVDAAEAVEAPYGAVAQIQTALDELTATSTDAPDESKGLAVEAIAPALPPENAAIETADPMGVPAVAKRRRSTRSKAKTSRVADAETAPVADASNEAQPNTPEVETPASVEVAAGMPVESASETLIEAAPEVENAPAKPRRRRPSRAKKTAEANAEAGSGNASDSD